MSLLFLNNYLIPTRKSSLPSPPISSSSSIYPPPAPSLLPSLKPQPSDITSMNISTTTEDSLGLEYQPLPKREKTSEEQQVEALARQLVGTWSHKLAVTDVAWLYPVLTQPLVIVPLVLFSFNSCYKGLFRLCLSFRTLSCLLLPNSDSVYLVLTLFILLILPLLS